MIDEDVFEALVEEGIASLPPWVQEKIENVAFIISDEPTADQRQENNIHEDETLFGLYEGVPLTERGETSPEFPDRITIFRDPILSTYMSKEDIRACVHNTIWHEVAHYFGHDEDWIEKEEIRRNKLL